MVKAKKYVSILLRALKDASSVDDKIGGFMAGIFSKAPIEVVIQKLNEQEDSIRLIIENIVKYYNKYKEEGKI